MHGNEESLGTHASCVLLIGGHEEHARSVRTQELSEERDSVWT